MVIVVAFVAVAFAVRAHLTPGRPYSRTDGARVAHYTLHSRLLGRDLAEVAIVPAGAGPRPLLVLLHGRHDPPPFPWSTPSVTGPESVLSNNFFDGLSALGPRAPVVVLIDGGGHSYYHDRTDGQWGSMVLDEAIPDAEHRFRTIAGTVAIGGESMGGYGALHLAALRPREFCAVGGHSAALWTAAGQAAPGAFDNEGDYARNDVFTPARNGAYAGLAIWIDGGTADPFRAADAALVTDLRAGGASVSYHVWPGGHGPTYWNAHMAEYLAFYASHLAACAR
jgi:S-formylglutathione hydrolase FrmB